MTACRTSPPRSFLALLLWLCLAATSAAAQPEPATPPGAAETLFDAGLMAAKRGALEQAAELFTRSQALEPAPNTLLNLALVYNRLDRPLETLSTLDALAALAPNEAEATETDKARSLKADKLRAQAEARVAVVSLQIAPATATVTIDGKAAESRQRLLPGQHQLRAEAEGHEPAEWSIELAAGQALLVERTLVATAPPLPTLAITPTREEPQRERSAPLTPGPAARQDDHGDKRARRWKIGMIVGAAVFAAVGTGAVVWLTQDDGTPKAPQGETRF